MRRFAAALSDLAERLKADNQFDYEHRVPAYLDALRIENELLASKRANRSGLEDGRKRAGVLDDFLVHLMDEAAIALTRKGRKPPVITLIALGGYGRSELNPKSDVDITWIHAGGAKLPAGFEDMVTEVYNDILACEFDPGHSTRSLDETIREANKEMKSRTAMLEARFVWGDAALFAKFQQRFLKECMRPHVDAYLRARVADQADRHSRYGESVYMQEPNLKSGCGGLRDYQNLLWMSYFKYGVRTTNELVAKNYLNEGERRELDSAYDFIFRLRTELHLLTGLHTDVIFRGQQLELANRLGYDEPDILRRTESLMRDYYKHARNIYEITELISQRLALPKPEDPEPRGLFRFLPLRRTKKAQREEFDGFVAIGDQLYPRDRLIFKEDSGRMMRLFRHVQLRGVKMSADLRQLVRRRLKYVDDTFRYGRANREVFAEILRHKGQVGTILRAMHRVDFLGAWMPEFGSLTALVQHEYFHRYTVDEHTLVCIEKLDGLLDIEDERFAAHKKLFVALEDPFVLYLALILHDTGKAANVKSHATQSAVNAQNVSRRLQLTREQRQLLIFLVDSHDLLARTAKQQDLQDMETVEEFAKIVGNQTNLDMLMLLTAADGLGVGDDKMWNDWTQSLVRTLYRLTTQYFADSEGFRHLRAVERDTLRAEVQARLSDALVEEVSAHFEKMEERYFLTHGMDRAGEIAEHVRMFHEFLECRWNSDENALAPVLRWVPLPYAGHSELWVCTWDRRHLLARICGALAAAELNILSADIYTRADGLVLDMFRVCTARFEAVEDKRDLRQVEKLLNQALQAEQHDFGPLLAKAYKQSWKREQPSVFPPRVFYDNTPIRHTLIEIMAPDRLGLLYDLLRTISESGYEIVSARITTEIGAAIDSFYITGIEGAKIPNDGCLDRLKRSLREVAAKRIS